MYVKLVVAGLVALAGFALSITTGTYSAPTRSVDLGGNRLAAGVLRLDLAGGGAAADLSFPGLMPGQRSDRRVWVAANDPASPVAATLSVRLDRLRDVAGDGRGRGHLSGLLEFQLGLARASTTASGCTDTTVSAVALPVVGAGNLRGLAGGEGAAIRLASPVDGSPLVLAPGDGVCVSVSAYWPPSDADNAAQGDTMSVRVVFELSQVQS